VATGSKNGGGIMLKLRRWIDKAEETLEKSTHVFSDETVEEAGVEALIAIAIGLERVASAIENTCKKGQHDD
tara:strand:- start:253 stop:468 length:216 start_codon:yes stop_codon:yes gene_type:complete